MAGRWHWSVEVHRDPMEEGGWISEDDYSEGLALAQLAPEPLAAQVGVYIDYPVL